jgi:hypothetical protein
MVDGTNDPELLAELDATEALVERGLLRFHVRLL